MKKCIRPGCKGKRCVPDGDRNFYCPDCGATFDDSPDEGGDYHTDPSRRMEKREEREGRRFVRRPRA